MQWNTEQANTMMYQPFVLLLHKLGFQLPADAGSVFARIPEFWTPEMMFNLAKKLGPLEKCELQTRETIRLDYCALGVLIHGHRQYFNIFPNGLLRPIGLFSQSVCLHERHRSQFVAFIIIICFCYSLFATFSHLVSSFSLSSFFPFSSAYQIRCQSIRGECRISRQ